MSKDNEDTKVHTLPGHEDPPEINAEIPAEALAALKNSGEDKLVGYIISPDVMAGLLDICEDVPGRYYKRLVPGLQSAARLVEGADGVARVINT
jgi:hypothetical protein